MLITPAQTFAYVWSCSARLLPISFLIIVCACSVEAASEVPDPASASKPEPSDQGRIQSVSKAEISQLEQLIVSQNEAIENLKAKIDRQQSLIDKLADKLQMLGSTENVSHHPPDEAASLAPIDETSESRAGHRQGDDQFFQANPAHPITSTFEV